MLPNSHQSEALCTSSYLLYQPIGIVPGYQIDPYLLSSATIKGTTWDTLLKEPDDSWAVHQEVFLSIASQWPYTLITEQCDTIHVKTHLLYGFSYYTKSDQMSGVPEYT
jgi:hypothetical protein